MVPALLERRSDLNLRRWDHDLGALGLPTGEFDVVLFFLFYHDLFWQKTDRAAFNASVLDALEPGGIFAVSDHRAEAGSGARDVESLHRGDAEQIKAEILAAGFELVAESDLLANPEDPRTKNVFKKGVRGKTDRFLYKFRKPEAQ